MCERDDPFHNFDIDTNASSFEMTLQMPSRVPKRIDHMAQKCLGRKRPEEYDDSDPFLKPCPSVVSRKMHGKTLPRVRRVKCADPLVFKDNDPNCYDHLA